MIRSPSLPLAFIMVLFPNCHPDILNAYSTVPLTPNIITATQHAIWDGSFARFGNPTVTVVIHDRPEFYNISHYQIRTRLDSESMLSDFLVIDENTVASDAAWLVESTEQCHLDTASAIEGGYPPITHPGENFTLWQIHQRTSDLPVQWASWSVGSGDMAESLYHRYIPYDPHNPQMPPFTLGVNWTDRANAGFWGPAYIKANFFGR